MSEAQAASHMQMTNDAIVHDYRMLSALSFK